MNRYGLSDQDLDKVYGIFKISKRIIRIGNGMVGNPFVTSIDIGYFKGFIHDILFSLSDQISPEQCLYFEKVEPKDISGAPTCVESVSIDMESKDLLSIITILLDNFIINKIDPNSGFIATAYKIYNKDFDQKEYECIKNINKLNSILSKLSSEDIEFLVRYNYLNVI